MCKKGPQAVWTKEKIEEAFAGFVEKNRRLPVAREMKPQYGLPTRRTFERYMDMTAQEYAELRYPTLLSARDVVKDRPLTFLAQFNCAELAQFDKEHLLPDHGLLSFFYETDTQCWGYDPNDKGCARVYWFEDMSALSAADFPADMGEDFKFPMVKIQIAQKTSYPSWTDFSEVFPDEKDYDAFDLVWNELTDETPENRSQLLGWPDVIQNSMFSECDLVTQGYYLGNGWLNIPKEVRQRAEETARDRWMLLFQLDTVEQGNFELMFGDCGHIYFYITKEDLAARRFDRMGA